PAALRLEDGARRHEYAPQDAGRRRGEAAEWRNLGLQVLERRFAQEGKLGQGLARAHRCSVHALQMRGPPWRVRRGVPNEVGEQVQLREFTLRGITRLELVVVLMVHGASSGCGGPHASQRLRRL